MPKEWISVRNWRKFQHYDPEKRQPPWIKAYTELMSDDTFRDLSNALRGVLVGIWLEYARSRCALRRETVSLTRQLGQRVSNAQLDRLNQAGYIDFVASKTLAEGYQAASTTLASRAPAHSQETETETETEVEKEAYGVRLQRTNSAGDPNTETAFHIPNIVRDLGK